MRTGDEGTVGGLVSPVESGSSGIVVFRRVVWAEADRGEAVLLARDFSQGGSLCGSSGEAGFRSSTILSGPSKVIRTGCSEKVKSQGLPL